MIRILLVFSMILTFCATASQPQVYRWKDENGNWVFSDVPRAGSEKISLNKPLSMPTTDTSILKPKKVNKAVQYELRISSPGHQQTIRENTGTVYVSGQVKPVFSKGLTVQLSLNGQLVSDKQTNTTFALHNLERGEHHLVMYLFDEHGTRIATSPQSTFYLHKTSRINP
ncbi:MULTISPECIES: DUF4124 domain-containing protein [Pseudoalteromonas]|uniref:DUF4124 domain-containing protein n=1 Tax=Pseudoalteromonas amylolytica TaxID=1859457 RepID=A0A1S1MRP6_9GAMM|nr:MULTISPECIES: DUF4124 domain-containing protein [Pseudoalteromonas]OHU86092.1 hypothetical protein BFC16_15375 [Pseudoalteromonas sp. JW3]OHU89800.1 hypothetical protein BET10_16940 [Pseudoalteromonas amylolytica]